MTTKEHVTERESSDSNESNDAQASVSIKKESIGKGEARARRRKSNCPYPPSSFEEAVSFVRGVYEFNSGFAVRKLSYFDHLGRSPDSSASRDAITNANKYGLIKSSFAAEQIEITDSGMSIVAVTLLREKKQGRWFVWALKISKPFRKPTKGSLAADYLRDRRSWIA